MKELITIGFFEKVEGFAIPFSKRLYIHIEYFFNIYCITTHLILFFFIPTIEVFCFLNFFLFLFSI